MTQTLMTLANGKSHHIASFVRLLRVNPSQFFHCYHTEESNTIVVEKLGGVTTIGINRIEKRNCIDMDTAKRLAHALDNFEEDDDSTVGVLYGKGGNFCAGYDLQELSNINELAKIRDTISRGSLEGFGPMGPTRRVFKKPVIAGISGYAVAGGFELALACDLRVVEESAVMGVFNRRFGVPLVDGGTVRLPSLIGLSRSLDLILTGRPISAKEALEWGIANRLVAVGTALGQAVNLARSIAKFPQHCLLADRASAYENAISPSTSFLQEAVAAVSNIKVLKESVEGATKFSVEGTGKHGKFHLDGSKRKEVD